MIDFLKAHIFIGKDSVFFDYLDKISEYSNGWVYYTLKGCKDFDVRYNAESGWLEIKEALCILPKAITSPMMRLYL